ncbi:MAG: diadenylate cyclase CdaA [Candidatus Margulisiibacteriota bacterium]
MMPFELRWVDLIDIFTVAVIIYYSLLWLQGTRAISLIRGLIVLLSLYATGRLIGLYTINWLFEKFAPVVAVMLVILFQPELRRTLERFGRGRILGIFSLSTVQDGSYYIRSVVRAVQQLSEEKIGALIVIERVMGMTEHLESGVRLDSLLSTELLLSIFEPRSPLHDGAVIVQGDRIVSASCLLPISDSRLLDHRLGTRHRAAVGLSEISDAMVIVVSEKTGIVSVAENGSLIRHLTSDLLEEKLFALYRVEKPKLDLFGWKHEHQTTAK